MPEELLRQLDRAAADAGLKRSQAVQRAARQWLAAREADAVRERVSRYYADHPDELAADPESGAWNDYQRSRMSREYGDDDW